jgi:hypothetical protein
VKKLCCSPRVLRFVLVLLGAVQVLALLIASERRAQAYVDPGSGFVFLQVAGSMVAGSVYYLRHRIKRIFSSLRGSQQMPTPAVPPEVIENQP